jgi:hypothetical protein
MGLLVAEAKFSINSTDNAFFIFFIELQIMLIKNADYISGKMSMDCHIV